ncbi:hypothetical protein BGY98DRAFT_594526 [Russula aff. rugulosa BPL654]|nr:hypothetical protein BGY98DRAFT_594526 [Russula aff. rugulosa BPL654]
MSYMFSYYGLTAAALLSLLNYLFQSPAQITSAIPFSSTASVKEASSPHFSRTLPGSHSCTPRAPLLVQRYVGRDEEKGRTVQPLHRGPTHHPRRRLGRYLPASGSRRVPYLIPDRVQSLVDDLLILIVVLDSHRLPKKTGGLSLAF